MKYINIVKLSVGSESIESIAAWQDAGAVLSYDGYPCHITRMWPKREAEILAGGSIYWVIKGSILARQRILRLDEAIGSDGIRRCAFVLEPTLVATQATLRRPFQGWRYLKPEESPMDLPKGRETEEALPSELANALADIGVI